MLVVYDRSVLYNSSYHGFTFIFFLNTAGDAFLETSKISAKVSMLVLHHVHRRLIAFKRLVDTGVLSVLIVCTPKSLSRI